MKNVLRRLEFRVDGVFSEFIFEGEAVPFMVTLSHAYKQDDGSYLPKVPPGLYACVFGPHSLHGGALNTYEITGVPGHTGILFHVGNYNSDSEGCEVCGREMSEDSNGIAFVTSSKDTFSKFIKRLGGTESFLLEVI